MLETVHVIDAGDGASALLACAVGAIASAEGSSVVAVGTSAGRRALERGGLRIQAWASPPCGIMRLAARPVARAVVAACGESVPSAATCWSADAGRASALASCMRRAMPRVEVRTGSILDAAAALRAGAGAGVTAAASADDAAGDRLEARVAIGAGETSLVVLGAADAPRLANALRMLDVAGRAMLAGADVHLVLPACVTQLVRTQRYARGLGIDGRVHVVEDADWPVPWWRAADLLLVTEAAPLVEAAAIAVGVRVLSAPGHAGDEASPVRRAAAATVRDGASTAIVAAARARVQSDRNASAASV